jgi:phosphate transport system permease protein
MVDIPRDSAVPTRELAGSSGAEGRRPLEWPSSHRHIDDIFRLIVTAFGAVLIALVALIAFALWQGSAEARSTFGFGFVTSSDWDPVAGTFGAAPYIFGTIVTSAVALLIAGPIGIGTAIFLTELAPRWLRAPVGFLVEMLAAIPSIIYGLWALFALVPVVRNTVEPFLEGRLGFLPIFTGPKYGVGLLAASLILTIMVLPTITAISRAVLETVPPSQRDGAYALGATRWEVAAQITFPAARAGITGAMILGLGRALGETMAVTIVIGNRGNIGTSLFALGDTMASVIANQFSEASFPLYTSALVEIGLLLFVLTILLNLAARLLIWRTSGAHSMGRHA